MQRPLHKPVPWPRHQAAMAAVGLAALLGSLGVAAQEGGGDGGASGAGESISANPYTVSISEMLSRDSNVQRAPDGQAQTDAISTTTLQLGLDQWLGRQHLSGDARLALQRFRDHSEYNNTSPALRLQLDWSAADRWQGELGARHEQMLYRDFSSGSSTQRDNLERTDEAFLRARVGVVTQWTVESALTAYQRRFTDDSYASSELDRKAIELGLRYQPQPDLRLRTLWRYTDGRYPHAAADGTADAFERRDLEATMMVRASGASTLDLRLTHSNEHHHGEGHPRQRLWSGSLGWQWQPTAKLNLELRALRDSDTGSEALSDGLASRDAQLGTELKLSAHWRATEKLQVSARWQQTVRDLQRDQGTPEALQGSDRLRRLSLGVDWQPWRAFGLGCELGQERRRSAGSSELSTPYGAATAGCYGRLRWR